MNFVYLPTDGTDNGDACTTLADSCTYPNAKCIPTVGVSGDGQCGCEDGLEYDVTVPGCCKCCCQIVFNKTRIILSAACDFYW